MKAIQIQKKILIGIQKKIRIYIFVLLPQILLKKVSKYILFMEGEITNFCYYGMDLQQREINTIHIIVEYKYTLNNRSG